MDRLERRILLLRGRRESYVDRVQFARQASPRAIVARRIRVYLQRNRLVMLRHPRWSGSERFLAELTQDLRDRALGMRVSSLDLAASRVRRAPEAWSRLLALFAELLGASLPPTAAWPVAREGFRHGLAALLERAKHRERTTVVICRGAQVLPLTVLEDLVAEWSAWQVRMGDAARYTLLLAIEGSVDVDPGSAALVDLPDFSDLEAVRYLVSHVGPSRASEVTRVVRDVGGLPLALDEAQRWLARGSTEHLVQKLRDSPAFSSVREAQMIVCSDDQLGARMEHLAVGAQPYEPGMDDALIRAGLAVKVEACRPELVQLRAPILSVDEEDDDLA